MMYHSAETLHVYLTFDVRTSREVTRKHVSCIARVVPILLYVRNDRCEGVRLALVLFDVVFLAGPHWLAPPLRQRPAAVLLSGCRCVRCPPTTT